MHVFQNTGKGLEVVAQREAAAAVTEAVWAAGCGACVCADAFHVVPRQAQGTKGLGPVIGATAEQSRRAWPFRELLATAQ